MDGKKKTDGLKYGWMERETDGQMNGRMDGKRERKTDRQMGRKMNEWMDGFNYLF